MRKSSRAIDVAYTTTMGENVMQDLDIASVPSAARTTIITGLATLAIGIVVASTAIVVAPRQAAALPAYAAKEGKACGYCHVNPAGGGERNAAGKKYEAGGHSFKK
jgi:hypothetical protein